MRKVIACLLSFMMIISTFVISAEIQAAEIFADEAIDVSTLKASELLDMSGLEGWATMYGDGVETVTGGGDMTPVLATDFETLSKLAGDNVPRVIIVSGTIKTSGYTIDVGSNKTIIGIDSNAVIEGGISIKGACNIIISNLTIHGSWPITKPDDGLCVHSSHHIWLDHLSIWDAPDGNLDIVAGSNYITVSWCKFWYTNDSHDHRFSNLVSSGTSNDATDLNKLNVTYHHNWFADKVDQRMPRLLYGDSHVYNNYYTAAGNTYCIGVGCYAAALIENNYFKNVNHPHQFMYGHALPAYIEARDNIYDNTTGAQDEGSVYNSSVKAFDNPPYTYHLDKAEDVPALVEAYAGAQDILDSAAKPAQGTIVTPKPTAPPKEVTFSTPEPIVDDNPITFDEESGIYKYNGQNSDGTNGQLVIDNPFKGMDLSEEVTYDTQSGAPIWENGVTITYWVKMPKTATDIPVLNFNLTDVRKIGVADLDMYEKCQEAVSNTGSYKMGEISTYYSMSGNPILVLKGTGRNSKYNPLFGNERYYIENDAGIIAAYAEGADPLDESGYVYLKYYGEGYYKNYGVRYDEEGGEQSLLPEAYVDGSLSLYASGSVGFAADNGSGQQLNPNLDSYGIQTYMDKENYLRYWGNGGTYSLNYGLTVPTMENREEWHFVVTVIKNDWIQTYVDGVELNIRYLNINGKATSYRYVASTGFNLGFGSSIAYQTLEPDRNIGYGDTILDLITDENTVLTIGGTGAAAARLGQDSIKTEEDAQIKDVRFYTVPIESSCVGIDRVQTFESGYSLKGTKLVEIEADLEPIPTPVPTATPVPTQIPSPTPIPFESGDVNMSGNVDAIDALMVLKHAARIEVLSQEQLLYGDLNDDNVADALDALTILKIAAKIID